MQIGRHVPCDPDDVIADHTKERPIKHSFCVSLRRDVHWKSLILSILIYGCLTAITWCRLAVVSPTFYYNQYLTPPDIDHTSPCTDGYIYIPVAFVILLYLVYLVECFHCHTRFELKHKVDVQTVYYKMRQMRESLPILWWKAICYHYVRRTRQVTRYRNGDAFTSTQVYYERVNSHTAGCAFNFTNCGVRDDTKYTTGLEDYPATKIRFSKTYSFAHPDAKYEFEDQRNQFFTENERRDDYMETREGMDLLNVNFKENMIAFKDPDNHPWYVSHVIFWVASCLLLSWPLRVIIEYKTAYLHFHVHKVFGTNYASASQNGSTQITRVNTVASTDLELTIRNNFTIVPSYSEALLMDINATSVHTLHDANANITSPVLGPTRSVTWNNMSASTSNGHINSLLAGVHLHYNSCTLINQQTIDRRETASGNSRQEAIKNFFRSPWNRKRALQNGVNQRTMFILASPTSPDDSAMVTDGRMSSAFFTRENSTLDEASSTNQRNAEQTPIMHKESYTSYHGNNCNDHVSNTSSFYATAHDGETSIHNINKMETLREDEPNENGSSTTKPVRPTSMSKSAANYISQRQCLPTVCDNRPSCPKPTFIKSNLPNVPMGNILSEHSPIDDNVVCTPSSPPSYADALYMQSPHATMIRDYSSVTSERRSLLNDSQRQSRRYRSMMETSL